MLRKSECILVVDRWYRELYRDPANDPRQTCEHVEPETSKFTICATHCLGSFLSGIIIVPDDVYEEISWDIRQSFRKQLSNGGYVGRQAGIRWVRDFRSEASDIRSWLHLQVYLHTDRTGRPLRAPLPFNGAYRQYYGSTPISNWPNGWHSGQVVV